MSCRDSRLSSALVSFTRSATGLADNQVLSLNHALMREGADHPIDQEAWDAAISTTLDDYREGRIQLRRGMGDVVSRLNAARTETPSGGRLYAAQRLMARAQAAATAHNNHLTSLARDLGIDADAARNLWGDAFDRASNDRTLTPGRSFVGELTGEGRNPNLFTDRRSLYAYEQLAAAAAAARSRDTRPTIPVRVPIARSFIREVGYDPATNRCEMVMGGHDTVYSYRLTQDQFEDLLNSDSPGAYFNSSIRSNPDCRYDTATAAATATQYRCATCGQYAVLNAHACTTLPAAPPASLDTPTPPAATPVDLSGLATGDTEVDSEADETNASDIPSRDISGYTYLAAGRTLYDIPGINAIRLPGVERARSNARHNGASFPVQAWVQHDNDAQRLVSGDIGLISTERGQYELVTGEGSRTLQCTCPDYQANYRCEHIRTLQAALEERYLGVASPEVRRRAVTAATAIATAGLPEEYQRSLDMQALAQRTFQPLAVSYENNPEAFQSLYEEYRTKRAAYRTAAEENPDNPGVPYPIPYYTENAFGGLATRDSGRGFGIEIEYGFPDTMSHAEQRAARQAIGQELFNAGLTRSSSQGGYGASHGWTRDHHARGWSYEDDGTTGDRTHSAGGEIVSPIMYDEPETWTALATITDVLRRNGATPTTGAGMHVHVSTGDYDHRVENHNRLMTAYIDHEDVVYRLSTNPDRGRHRRNGYCSPNAAHSTPYTDVTQVARRHQGHHLAMNLQSVAGRPGDHVEFRTHDSTLNPAAMQAQIAMSVFLAAGASRDDTLPQTPTSTGRSRLGEHLGANPSREALAGNSWQESTLNFRRFLDRFLPGTGGDESENPYVRQLVAVFAATKWQRAR